MLSHKAPGRARFSLFWFFYALWATTVPAADFAEITPAERAFDAVPGVPNAAAVVIFQRAKIELMEYPQEVSSRLDLEVRIKVLTPQGAEQFGEVEIPHSRDYRLRNFKGRTVLPDGDVVEIGEDALFESEVSRRNRIGSTRAVFPAVEPGAILDYRYTLYWDSFVDPDPWYFASDVHTLESRVEYLIPRNLAVAPWAVQMGGLQIQSSTGKEGRDSLLSVWAHDVPALPDEPFSLPREDLSSRFLLVPHAVSIGGDRLELFQDWGSTAYLVSGWYDELQGGKRPIKSLAQSLVAGAGSKRQQIAALHTHVRDEIETRGPWGVVPGEKEGVELGDVIQRGWGTGLSKALILQGMLDQSGFDARLVWASDLRFGRADTNIANPYWFTRALVRTQLDGEEIWLDPVDRDLPTGHLSPYYQGQTAVAYDKKKPEVIIIEATPAEANRRQATLELAVDEEGVVAGNGQLHLSGHHAWAERDLDADSEPHEQWSEWLEEALPAVEISQVSVEDDMEANTTTVRWEMQSREEEVFGDQVTWPVAAPLGPVASPFTLSEARRLTPVALPWRDLDEIELELSWPPGWVVTQAPQAAGLDNGAGRFEALVEVDAAEHRLTYRRSLRLEGPVFNPGPPYGEVRALYQAAADHDARPLVLFLE